MRFMVEDIGSSEEPMLQHKIGIPKFLKEDELVVWHHIMALPSDDEALLEKEYKSFKEFFSKNPTIADAQQTLARIKKSIVVPIVEGWRYFPGSKFPKRYVKKLTISEMTGNRK